MALPSRDQTFAFVSCRELLEKLGREIDRYQEVEGCDEELAPERLTHLVDQLKDSAFNASVTAWHLCDWVFNDMTPEQHQKLGFEKLNDLQEYTRANCRALHLCRQTATASKHWIVNHYADPNVQVVVTGETGWTIYFVDEGKRVPAQQVFDEAFVFWTGFIYQHSIAKIDQSY